jgi:hypothetical protein
VDTGFIDEVKRMGIHGYLSVVYVHPYRESEPETSLEKDTPSRKSPLKRY